MDVVLSKWGNSLAIRIPARVAEEVDLKEGAKLSIETVDGELKLTPVSREPTLEEMMSAVTPENMHAETEWGTSAGGEAW